MGRSGNANKAGGSVLVVETDELSLRAGVCRLEAGGRCVVTAAGGSNRPDLGEALAETMAVLEARCRLPGQAILLSPQVQTAILQLPVDPGAPLPFAQMQELIRWEMEPYMAQGRTRRIGAILVSRGYLSRPDLERMLCGQEPIDEAAPDRLGERAVRAGLIRADQVEECLAIQRSGQDFSGEVACGWTPLGKAPRGQAWSYLVCGAPRAYRRHAGEAFRQSGLRLRALYPLVGCACASFNGSLGARDAVVEYNGGHLNYARFAEGQLVASRHVFTHDPGNPTQSCAAVLEPDAERVWLAGRWPDIHAAAPAIASLAGRPGHTVMPADAESPDADRADLLADSGGMRGAGGHFMAVRATAPVACVPADDPRAPIWSDRRVQAVLASLLVSALLAALGAQFRSAARAEAKALQEQRALTGRQGEVVALRAQQAQLNAAATFFQVTLPQRQRLVPDLLAALEGSCTDEITIRQILETPRGEIALTGTGATPQDIQAFKIRLQGRLARLSVTDGTSPIRQERDAHGPAGYSFELRLLPGAGPGERREAP